MRKWMVLLVISPVLLAAQSKRKQRLALEKEDAQIVANLQKHVQYLADDKLEGRRTGTKGEQLAMEYIIDQYKQLGLAPAGASGYVQEFEINEGKQVSNTAFLKVDGKSLNLIEDYIPLAFSKEGAIKGNPAMAMNESGMPWFKDLKDILEENKANPHFDIEEWIKKETSNVAAKKATALLLYNSAAITDNIQFNKNDKSVSTAIPVIYLTQNALKKYLHDHTASINIELQVGFTNNIRKAHNIIGFIDNKAANTVVLGAHYDHLGFGEDKNALDTGHVIHNGADDNASGTAALMELARLLKTKSPVNNNYLIMHFSGEELGLFGSKYWLENPTAKISANYMINMDMVGRYDTARKLTIGGFGTSPVWSTVVPTVASNFSYKIDSAGSGPSDHASFYRKDIPVLFLFTGSHSDYHKATDDWDKINYKGEKDIVRMIYKTIELTDSKGKIAFTKTAEQQMGRSTRFTVSLGVIPDYGYSGTGMRIDGVSAGKLAEKKGLQAGDILLQLGEYKFVDVNSYMQSLSKFKKGDKTILIFKRGNEEKQVEVEF
jgi:aminopeptidase YwaD